MQKIVSFIPARGGSKGIPRKNIIPLNNKPLISYAIESSLKSSINETWVSTDNNEIKEVSLKCGAKVILRPSELATDNSPTEDAIFHFLNNVNCDIVVFIQATSPLISDQNINQGIDLIKTRQYDSVFSACKTNDMLLWNPKLEPINYDFKNRGNRQNRPDFTLIETGGFYIFSKEGFLKYRNRLHGKIGFVEVPFWSSFEIDNPEDLFYIDKLLK